jgi:rare lipoprotein A
MRRTLTPAVLLLALIASGCASSRQHGATVQRGIASWYGPGFHGNRTASGQRYDMWALTAAHRTLPMGTIVEVRNLDNDRVVRVTINDRGPFKKHRVLDLSRAAAEALGIVGPGTAPVEIVAVGIEPIGGTSFLVQVGAFLEVARAQELAETLRPLYPKVSVTSDAVWSRVQLGEFRDRTAAERLAAELRRAGYAPLVLAISNL